MVTNEQLKAIKKIVADIDGTLLNNDGKPGLESKRLIGELMRENVVVSLATGRLHSAAIDLAKELSLNGCIISLDGAVIKSVVDDQLIFESFLRSSHVKKAIEYSEKMLINIALCHSDTIYYTENNSILPSLLGKYGAGYTKVESYFDHIEGTLEILCSSDVKNSIKMMEEKFNFPYSIGCDTSYFRSKKNENLYYLEIRKNGSSKGKALKKLLKYFKVKENHTAVLGDWYNDITLFQTNAVKIAVANAIPELIRLADYITSKSNKEDGTAEFFEMVLKSKRNQNG